MVTSFKRLLVAAATLRLAGAYTAAAAPTSGSDRSMNGTAVTLRADADSVTGCLHKGTKSGQYTLATADGKQYELTSKSVPLSKHVGHTVSVEGTSAGMSAGQTAGDTGSAKGMSMGGEMMDVTKLSMVSPKCQ
jgi:hypothetical protein